MGTEEINAISDFWSTTFSEKDPDAKRLTLKLIVIGLAICRDSEIWSREFGLSRGEMAVLMALFRAGKAPQRPTDLLLLLSMSSAGVTKQIGNLEKLGLVERRKNPVHKGGFLVRLTDEGRELARRARASKSWGPLMDALTNMSPRMQKEAEAVFDTLIKAAHVGATKRKSRAAKLDLNTYDAFRENYTI